MANLTAVIGADTSKFVSEIKSAQGMLDKFVKETESASSSAKSNVSATNEQISAYKRVITQLEKVGSGTMSTKQQQQALTEQIKELKVQWQNLSNEAKSGEFGKSIASTMSVATDELNRLKSQLSSIDTIKPTNTLKRDLRLTTDELVKLTAQYRALSAAEKQSAQGKELAAKMDELRNKAGSLSDTIGDVQQEIKTMASDTPNLDVFNNALGIGADLLSTYSSLVAKLTGDEEALKEAIATIATVQSAANLMTKVANALQSSSVLMLKTRKIQESATAAAIRIRTAAENKGTVATKAAKAAQAAFNLVAKANPYVLLATTLLGAGAALIAFTKHAKKAKEIEEEHQKALEKEKEEFDSFAESVGSAGGNLITKYALLTAEYKRLTTEHEKITWVKKNQKAFSDLGVSVNSVSDAENVFVRNTGAVVESIKKRALAAVKQKQLTELSAKLLEEQVRAEANYSKRQVKAGDKVGGTSHNSATGNEYVDRSGNWVYTEKGAEEANKRIRQESFATVNAITNDINKLATDLADGIEIPITISSNNGGGNTGNDSGVAVVAGSLAEANKKVAELKSKLENLNPSDESFSTIQNELEEWKKKQTELNELINGTKKEVKETSDEVSKLVSGSLSEADYFVKSLTEQLSNMSPNDDAFEETLELLNEWKKKQNEITEAINGTNNALEDTKEAEEPIKKILTTYDKFAGSASTVIGSINSIYDSFSSLSERLEEAKNGWESFIAVFEAGMSVLEGIANIIEVISTITEILNTVKKAGISTTQQDTQATIANATAKGTEATANITDAATSGAASAAKAGESVSSIPYVGPIMAVAAIASVMAAIVGMIASAKSFATGGIIDGKTSVGDYNIARVNGGEMILNGTQQKRLFNLLDGSDSMTSAGVGAGQVEFKIRGTELIGCINNTHSKMNKI